MHAVGSPCPCVKWTYSGPVDATYKAIDSLVKVQSELLDYGVNSVTEGINALACTRVIIRPAGALAEKAVSRNATGNKVARSFSGAGRFEENRGGVVDAGFSV